MADRHEAWGIAHDLLNKRADNFTAGFEPYDVLSLAQWLAADND